MTRQEMPNLPPHL